MMTRRSMMMLGSSLLVAAAAATGRGRAEEVFEITHTEEEWRKLLTPESYAVLREENTEPSGSSPLNTEHRKGTFFCAGCNLALYASEAKYDSGTGWPSFFEPLENAVATKADWGLLGKRTEVHCRRCGGHLGHVFNDGPAPTGKRYCMNGLALVFRAA